MAVLRRLVGEVLRRTRLRQERTLREVSSSARVSLGYLSEVERGQKEPSSELLASICDALGVPMSTLMREVSDELALAELAELTARAPELSGPDVDPGTGSGVATAETHDRGVDSVETHDRGVVVAA